MDYSWSWWGNPYFWALAVALCIGFSLASLTRFAWVFRKRIAAALFAVSGAIIVAVAGVFIVDNETLPDIGLAYSLGIGTICFGAIFRFPRTVGIPILSVAVAAAVFFVVSLESWYRYDPGSPVGHVSILARDDESMRFEVDLFSSRTITSRDGNTIGLMLEHLESSRFWFFGGRYARLIDVTTEMPEAPARSPLIARLPGWNYSVMTSEPFSPRDLYRYQLSIGPNHEIEWVLSVPGGTQL